MEVFWVVGNLFAVFFLCYETVSNGARDMNATSHYQGHC